jgi:hypothetical protein
MMKEKKNVKMFFIRFCWSENGKLQVYDIFVSIILVKGFNKLKSGVCIDSISYFFVSPVGLRHRIKVPAPFQHPVEVLCIQVFLTSNKLLAY